MSIPTTVNSEERFELMLRSLQELCSKRRMEAHFKKHRGDAMDCDHVNDKEEPPKEQPAADSPTACQHEGQWDWDVDAIGKGKGKGKTNPNTQCYNCFGKGHIAVNCPKGKGKGADVKGKGKGKWVQPTWNSWNSWQQGNGEQWQQGNSDQWQKGSPGDKGKGKGKAAAQCYNC